MENSISKTEYEVALNAIQKSLDTKVEEIELSEKIPTLNATQDNNKVFRGKLSVLFVDMRKSTDLTDDLKSKKMVKIYRSFIRMIIQAIRYSGGETRQFAGDGVMGVFQDSVDGGGEKVTSSTKAVQAARYIITMMDYCLNPLLSKNMDGLSIACGVGICTGTVLVTKVGMRGKEQDDTSENEMGLVWTGKTTNYASRYCSLANPREIFIDNKTYSELNDKADWNESIRVKGTKSFRGFISYEYYLDLDSGINQEPVKATNKDTGISFVQEIFDDTKEQSLVLIDEISKKSIELSKRIEEVKKRETECQQKQNTLSSKEAQLKTKESQLIAKQDTLNEQEIKLYKNEYDLHRKLFSDTYCKNDLIKAIGKEFWLKEITNIISIGKKCDMDDLEIQLDLCHYWVNIYIVLENYDKAYDSLCVQVDKEHCLSKEQAILISQKSNLSSRLRSKLEAKKYQSALCKEILDEMNRLGIGL